MAPVQQIPFDLLSEIFVLCSIAEPLAPMVIASVSHQWRQTILATPIAWSRIFIRFPGDIGLSFSYVSTFMSRSNPCLLHFGVLARIHQWPEDECSKSSSFCDCPNVRFMFRNSQRIQCLTIDASWFDEFSHFSYPNLTKLTITDKYGIRATTRLDLSDFPYLRSLDASAWECRYLDLPRFPPSNLEQFNVWADKRGYWDKLIRSYTGTLQTLRLYGSFRSVTNSRWILDLPMLKSLLINESYDLWNDNPNPPIFEINAPALTVLTHYSYQDGLQLIHKSTLDNLKHIRTNIPIQLGSYNHVHVLHLSFDRTLLEDILGQLEGDPTLCPYLAVIDMRVILTSFEFTVNHVKDRLAERNQRAGSNIKLISGPEYSIDVPEFYPKCGEAMPC